MKIMIYSTCLQKENNVQWFRGGEDIVYSKL